MAETAEEYLSHAYDFPQDWPGLPLSDEPFVPLWQECSGRDALDFLTDEKKLPTYHWEWENMARNIAYTWITQANDKLPCPIFWLAVNAPAENTYVPLTVNELPDAYRDNDRTKYDANKAWWISEQVTMLTRGYYSALQPEVLEAAHQSEANAIKLVADSSSLDTSEFARALYGNAEKTMQDWQTLFGEILARHDGNHRIDYGNAKDIKSDKVQKY